MAGPRTIATWTPRLLNIFPSTTYLLSRGPAAKAALVGQRQRDKSHSGYFPFAFSPDRRICEMRSRIVFTGRLRFAEINTHDLPASVSSRNRRSSSGVQFVPRCCTAIRIRSFLRLRYRRRLSVIFLKVDIQSHGARADG